MLANKMLSNQPCFPYEMGTNPYKPELARIISMDPMVEDNHLFRFRFEDANLNTKFQYKPGQFMEVSVLGVGESPISISSTPTRRGVIEMCIRRAGRVTNALYHLKPNDLIGLRGPFGNGFPVEEMKGDNLLIVAGGLGMVPLRSILLYALDNRQDYERIILLYGTRYPDFLLFRSELEALSLRSDAECHLIVEKPALSPKTPEWRGNFGMVTDLFDNIKELDVRRTHAVVVGPPIFYRFVLSKCLDMGFSKDRILMSLERRMECGIGKCGHCEIGNKKVCTDGPVFTYWDVMNLPEMI
ncbi:MAG: FAD/NAD(P)-binding protein [Calditrichia bacterium]